MVRRGSVMAGCVWMLLCLTAAQATAAQSNSHPEALGKGQAAGSSSVRGPGDGADSPLLAPPLGPSSDHASFWPIRDKRPSSPVENRRPRLSEAGGGGSWSSGDADEGSDEEDQVLGLTGPSRGGMFWVARGKKSLKDYLSYYWGSNQNVWGERPFARWGAPPSAGVDGEGEQRKASSSLGSGWESNQSFWGKRSGGNPFWIARGKRQDGGGPFWIARGKRKTEAQPGTAAEGEDLSANLLTKRQDGGGPFWISRGKKGSLPPVDDPLFWIIRGRKSGDAKTFWAARGKKEAGGKGPFWAARGKREGENAPFWIAQGKKDGAKAPFWVARGKKEGESHPFWIARGKKEDKNPFWISRGKKDEAHPFWIARGKKEAETDPDGRDQSWPAAGVPRPWGGRLEEGGQHDPLGDDLLQALLEAQDHLQTEAANDPFVALTG